MRRRGAEVKGSFPGGMQIANFGDRSDKCPLLPSKIPRRNATEEPDAEGAGGEVDEVEGAGFEEQLSELFNRDGDHDHHAAFLQRKIAEAKLGAATHIVHEKGKDAVE